MIPLISLFFISLISIIIMLSKKLTLLKNQGINVSEENHATFIELPFIQEIKHVTIKNIKKYGYICLVTVIRIYFRSLNLVKIKYIELKTNIKNIKKINIQNEIEKKEVSGFLKVVSNYKQKIRKIKHQIKEEEGVL